MTIIPKDTSEQLSKAGIAADFGIDIEQDLICSITGKSIDEKKYGKTVTGKDLLSLSVKINISSIKDFLRLCYEKYLSDEYKTDFGWIDRIAEIKDLILINGLNSKLIENIKNGVLEKTWMAVPEIIEWEHVSGFKYSQAKDEKPKEDIDIDGFLGSLSDDQKESLSIDVLKKKMIYCIDSQNGETRHRWNAYSCLYCEVHDEQKKTYLLSNGKWYEIESDYAQEVNAEFEAFRNAGSALTLPAYNHSNENDYNKAIATKSSDNFHCMDCDCISHGGAHSRIEFCDLISKEKKFIHIKRYGGSSVLSHLFSQGLVSGELFLRDAEFRTKLNAKLPKQFKISNPDQRPNASQFEIIYGIISSYQRKLDLPFFSKVSLRTAKNRLEAFGYKVSLLQIPKNGN